mmetsp:Transcript_3546/g.10302  ORF Transcript_3546/g.10302 Transcript_3546/m.10302 type:complete len:235 (-) Transcript_3546:2519-3223(-)
MRLLTWQTPSCPLWTGDSSPPAHPPVGAAARPTAAALRLAPTRPGAVASTRLTRPGNGLPSLLCPHWQRRKGVSLRSPRLLWAFVGPLLTAVPPLLATTDAPLQMGTLQLLMCLQQQVPQLQVWRQHLMHRLLPSTLVRCCQAASRRPVVASCRLNAASEPQCRLQHSSEQRWLGRSVGGGPEAPHPVPPTRGIAARLGRCFLVGNCRRLEGCCRPRAWMQQRSVPRQRAQQEW